MCFNCHKLLPHNHFCCYQCAAPFSGESGMRSGICGRCLSRQGSVDHSIIPFLYRPPVDFMIKRLKFSEQLKYSRLLGDLLADAVEAYYTSNKPIENSHGFPKVILPVPTHRQKLLQRGFNQAEQIANTVASRFAGKCDTSAVVRTRSSPPQSSLSAARREVNIRRSFEIVKPENINGLHVAVVDDVYTTGATAQAIATKLKSAGAARVSIWAVARTP